MKKAFCVLMGIVIISCLTAAAAETRQFGGLSFPADAVSIDMGSAAVEDLNGFIAFLKGFESLEHVDMFSTVVSKKEIETLTAACPGITFGWTINIANKHLIRTDQTAFSTLHGECVRHSSSDLEVLKYCTELIALDLGHNTLTDVSFLKPLTKLKVLILADNRNISGLDVISNFKDLEYLELFTCNVRDISMLEGLTHLMDLNLANNHVRDNSVLFGLPNLKRLWIADMGSVPYGQKMEALKAAIPDAVIMTEGHPTANGWRKNTHYDVIYEIFHTDVYIPFEESFEQSNFSTDEGL